MGDEKRKNLSGLNYLRAISALLVVFYHYTTRYLDVVYKMGAEKSRIGLWWGCWAVSVFFILSGFLTLYSMNEKIDVKSYFKKRVIRLYPAYWTAIIITTVVTYLFMPTMITDIKSTLFNFTMFQGFVGVSPVDGAYWTLKYELEFYVIVGALIFLLKHIKLKNGYEKFSAVWVLSVLGLSIVNQFNITNVITKVLNILIMPQYAHTFVIGISLYYITKDKKNYLSYFNLAVSLIIHILNFSVQYAAFVVLIIILIFFIAKKEVSFKYDKVLVWISNISFPLYLVHQKVGYTIIHYCEKFSLEIWTGIVLAFCASLILAHLIHVFVEKPVLNFYKKTN